MCYCCHLHYLCCEAGELHLLSLWMKHHPGLYDVHHNYQKKKKERKKEGLACNLMKNKNNNNKKRFNIHWEWRRKKKLKLVASGTQAFLKHNPTLISWSFNLHYLTLSYTNINRTHWWAKLYARFTWDKYSLFPMDECFKNNLILI